MTWQIWEQAHAQHLSFVQEVIPGDQTRRITVRGHNKWRLWERATSSNISCLTLCAKGALAASALAFTIDHVPSMRKGQSISGLLVEDIVASRIVRCPIVLCPVVPLSIVRVSIVPLSDCPIVRLSPVAIVTFSHCCIALRCRGLQARVLPDHCFVSHSSRDMICASVRDVELDNK